MSGRTVPLSKAIETLARALMDANCPFEGVSGDFDNCSALTRQRYEEDAASAFGLTLTEYYDLCEEQDDEPDPKDER